MPLTGIVGFADFFCVLPLKELAERLSAELFAGVHFSDEQTGEWDEVYCLHLDQDYLGLRVVLGGDEKEGYSLDVTSTLKSFPDQGRIKIDPDSGDISEMIKELLLQIPGITLTRPRHSG